MNKITFPFNGINNNSSYETQPLGTCASAQNVRGYDAIKGRLRGGQRAGLSKWHVNQINGSEDITDLQRIKTQVIEEDTAIDAVYSSKNNDRYIYSYNTDTGNIGTFLDLGAGNIIYGIARDSSGNVYVLHGQISGKTVSKYDSSGNIIWQVNPVIITASTTDTPLIDYIRNRIVFLVGSVIYALNLDTGTTVLTKDFGITGPSGSVSGSTICLGSDNYYYATGGTKAFGGGYATMWKIAGDGTFIWRWAVDASGLSSNVHTSPNTELIIVGVFDHTGTTSYGKDAPSAGALANYWILNQSGEVQSSGSVNKASADMPKRVHIAPDGDYYVGFGSSTAESIFICKYNGSDDTEAWDYYIATTSIGIWTIIEDATGDYVYVGGELSTTWEGTDAGSASIWKLSADGVGMPEWDATTGSICSTITPYNIDGAYSVTSVEVLSAVCGDTIKALRNDVVSTPANGDGAVDGGKWLSSQSAYGHIFFVDGAVSLDYTIGYTADDDSISTWAATSGTLPENCKLAALYRGRVLLSANRDDAHNWYMSKVGDPFDWDYFPSTTSAIQAVAGNNSEVGLIGDNINGIAPWSDDLCIFGCDSSLWLMAGDPAAGGSIDLITDKTGMTFGKAWCFDPNGVMYFHGVSGIFRLVPGGKPESITDDSIKRIMESLDLSSYYIRLYWDINQGGLYMVYIKQDYSAIGSIYFWDMKQNAWWYDEYLSATTTPLSFYAFDADAADDRHFLMGCKDGYIRKIDNAATTDDGVGITSNLIIGPYIASPGKALKLSSIDCSLGKTSGNLDLYINSGDYAEDAIVSLNTRVKRTMKAGLNRRINHRVSAPALQFKLESPSTVTTQWALENLSINIKESGTVRGGRV